jgi:hypothetical protein
VRSRNLLSYRRARSSLLRSSILSLIDAARLSYWVRSTAITEVENFIKDQKRRGVKNSTIWHYVKDLRALFYWAMKNPERKRPFVRFNPVSGADLDSIREPKSSEATTQS